VLLENYKKRRQNRLYVDATFCPVRGGTLRTHYGKFGINLDNNIEVLDCSCLRTVRETSTQLHFPGVLGQNFRYKVICCL
jgi:hypothetical protein